MNSALTKVSNLKVNKASKIGFTFVSSVFFLYALGQAPILKNILAGALSPVSYTHLTLPTRAQV